MGILSAAFMAWAGVVYTAANDITKTLTEFIVATEHRLTAIEVTVDDLKAHNNYIGKAP